MRPADSEVRQERRAAAIGAIDSGADALDRAVAADVLLRHLFVPPARRIEGVQYAALYRFAEKYSGGDVIDVYQCNGNTVCFSLTDISGKGATAALHAGLVKYGIRAFASEGHRPAVAIDALNRFYHQNNAFEHGTSFATVFFASIDLDKRRLTYASAGHEPVLMVWPDGMVEILSPTGPVVGIFDESPDLFFDRTIDLEPGAVLLAASDGITEARHEGVLFGMDRMGEVVRRHRTASMREVATSVVHAAVEFAGTRVVDDMAVLAARLE